MEKEITINIPISDFTKFINQIDNIIKDVESQSKKLEQIQRELSDIQDIINTNNDKKRWWSK